MSKLKFYLSLLASAVILTLAAGMTAGIPMAEMLRRTLIGLGISAISGAATAQLSKRWLPGLDGLFAGWGFDISSVEDPRVDRAACITAAVTLFYSLLMLFLAVYSPYVTADYVKKSVLSDTKLLELATADTYNCEEVSRKYHITLNPAELAHIPEAAVSRMRSPESIRQAALELGKSYRPVEGDPGSEGFLKAIARLKSMKRGDLLARVFYGLREYGKDRGIGVPIGALIKITEISDDAKFLESVIQDVTVPVEVKRAAAKKINLEKLRRP